MSTTAPTLFDYARFVEDLKRRIDGARLSAARAVNRELVALYWDIGQAIREQQARRGWGDAVVDRLAHDLKASFPGTTGFSAASLWRMRQFHETYAAPEFLAQLVRERERDARRTQGLKALKAVDHHQLAQAVREMVEAVPWGHHVNLLSKLDDAGQRLFYLKATARFGWSRNVLLNQIKARAYERSLAEGKVHNFALALPRAPASGIGALRLPPIGLSLPSNAPQAPAGPERTRPMQPPPRTGSMPDQSPGRLTRAPKLFSQAGRRLHRCPHGPGLDHLDEALRAEPVRIE